jgi:hypothetical protein
MSESESKTGIIASVQTPLGLFALIVLAVEGLIGALAVRASADEVPKIIFCMIGILALVIVVAGIIYRSQKTGTASTDVPAAKEPLKYDVFISAPMAAFTNNADYQASNVEIKKLIDVLRRDCGWTTFFYAGMSISSLDQFDLENTLIEEDSKAVLQSRYFILIYPEKTVSSVLVEAGMALALHKPSLYFVRNEEDLPFILRGAARAKQIDAQAHVFKDYADLAATVCKAVKSLRPPA